MSDRQSLASHPGVLQSLWAAVFIFILLGVAITPFPARGQSPPTQPVVRVVLFWTDGCPDCHYVLDEILPPIQREYGEQFQIRLIEVATVEDYHLLLQVAEAYNIGREQVGVPFLIIGDRVLIGSTQIPAELPALIKDYLAAGGVDYPLIPGLQGLPPQIAAQKAQTATPVNTLNAASDAVVHAILFTTPDCHSCQLEVTAALAPVQEKYGAQFVVRTIDVITLADVEYLHRVASGYGITPEQVDLPLLIIGKQALIGEQMVAELPNLTASYLATGGVEYPYLPEAKDLSTTEIPNNASCPPYAPCAQESPLSLPASNPPTVNGDDSYPQPEVGKDIHQTDVLESIPLQPSPQTRTPSRNGFSLAIGVLIGMALAVLVVGIVVVRTALGDGELFHFPSPYANLSNLALPILAVLGLGVAAYLAYVETQSVSAVCGPVGDCNAVQSSPYARLFGVLPIGVLGMAGYIAILAAWLVGQKEFGWISSYARLGVFGMAFGGSIFSLYLTYLEPFVIKAVCIWCIASAIVITLILLCSVTPAMQSILENENDLPAED